MIGAWPELVKLKNQDLIEEARDQLLQTLSDFQSYEGKEVWCVFDAQFVPGITKEYSKYRVKVIFTAQGETADTYIEGVVKKLHNVITDVAVATSDLAEQQVVFARGAARLSANDLYQDIKRSKKALDSESKAYRNQRQRGTWNDEQMAILKDIYKDMLE